VIGEPLPAERVVAALDRLVGDLGKADWRQSAGAIMTTDTFPKGAGEVLELDGVTVNLAGICKGSGMIEPDMATMLGFIFTDAAVSRPLLARMLAECTDSSFNAITVDSDTSTSDSVLLVATGAAGNPVIDSADDPRYAALHAALGRVAGDLARQIVRDGEGASKFITIDVDGAEDDRAAKVIAKSIANSPLVKTAIAGEDANWGRVVMAVGKAGEAADRDRLSISMGGIEIAADGQQVPGYDEARVAAHLKGREIHIGVDLGLGQGRARVWTCDLTEGYIRINADYRS
jgi:glutamate N-acetyltransferase/amino-acid N-acetyltransferase